MMRKWRSSARSLNLRLRSAFGKAVGAHSLGSRLSSLGRWAALCPIIFNALETYKHLTGYHPHRRSIQLPSRPADPGLSNTDPNTPCLALSVQPTDEAEKRPIVLHRRWQAPSRPTGRGKLVDGLRDFVLVSSALAGGFAAAFLIQRVTLQLILRAMHRQ